MAAIKCPHCGKCSLDFGQEKCPIVINYYVYLRELKIFLTSCLEKRSVIIKSLIRR